MLPYPQPPRLKIRWWQPPAPQLPRRRAIQFLMAAGFEDDAIYCDLCEMYLNGEAQWADHLLGKKHKKNLARNDVIASSQGHAAESPDAPASPRGQASQEPLAPPGFIMIRLLAALSGSCVGSVLCRNEATWQEVAAVIVDKHPRMQPVPPSRARHLIAADLEVEGVQVMFRPEPYA